MINQLHIRNFKCLRNTMLSFEPLTVLIGPNDSGKTSILEALYLLGQTPHSGLGRIFTGPRSLDNITWHRVPQLSPIWELQATVVLEEPEAGVSYRLSTSRQELIASDNFQFASISAERNGANVKIPQSPGNVVSYSPDETSLAILMKSALRPKVAPAIDAMTASGIYRLDPRALRRVSTPKVGDVLSSTGDNLAAILDGLLSGPNRRSVNDMEDALRRAMPTLDGFSTPPAPEGSSGEKTINFVLAGDGKKPVTIPCELASDGAMLLTAFLALAYSDTPEVLLIEEPENGLHPGRLKEVIDLLRKMTTGEVGNKRRQIILTTHSPLLLNYAKPEEVRIVRRNPEEGEGTQVTPLQQVKGIEDMLKEFGVGELWYLLGEQGLVEGQQP